MEIPTARNYTKPLKVILEKHCPYPHSSIQKTWLMLQRFGTPSIKGQRFVFTGSFFPKFSSIKVLNLPFMVSGA